MMGVGWFVIGTGILVFLGWQLRGKYSPKHADKVIIKRKILVTKRTSFYPLSKRETWVRDDQQRTLWYVAHEYWIPYEDILHVEISQDRGEVIKTYGYRGGSQSIEETVGEWKDTVKYVQFMLTIRNDEDEEDDLFSAVLVDFPKAIGRQDQVAQEVMREAEDWYDWFKTIIDQNTPPLQRD